MDDDVVGWMATWDMVGCGCCSTQWEGCQLVGTIRDRMETYQMAPPKVKAVVPAEMVDKGTRAR